MIEHKEIGQRIELRRKDLDLTLADVAMEVGVAASTIQRYEKGQFDKIKMPVIEAIAAALHVNPEWLIGETDDPVDYEDGDLLASIPLSYMELFDGDAQKALQYMKAVDENYAKEKTPALTEKDERDIAKDLERIMTQLETEGDLMFDGDPMSDEARESIRAAMKLGLEAAKLKNKERFTPKKYRKEQE